MKKVYSKKFETREAMMKYFFTLVKKAKDPKDPLKWVTHRYDGYEKSYICEWVYK